MNQLNPTMPQNEANPRVMHSHNTFPMSHDHALTARFADETPFFVFDSEAGDKIPFSSFHDFDTLTLSTRFKSPLNMHKTYFSVPYRAILPNTWDLFYANPTQGDDVPDDVFPSIPDALTTLQKVLDSFTSELESITESSQASMSFTKLLRYYFLLEAHFSDGSLLSYLGCKLNKYFTDTSAEKPFAQFESFSRYFLEALYECFIQTGTVTISTYSESVPDYVLDSFSANPDRIKFRSALEFMRDNPDFNISLKKSTELEDFYQEFSYSVFTLDLSMQSFDIPLNYSRCVAYQLAYHHFLTNDKVDYIYSANLFRNTRYTEIIKTFSADNISFEYNGNKIMYDAFCGKFIKQAFNIISNNSQPAETNYSQYCYLYELLAFRKSLKFGDYFTGSRPTPLAVGDVTAPVVGNGVSALDMTKNISAQRFLNAVNKTGRKLSEYMKGIRGVTIAPDPNDPRFLARDTCRIGNMQIENTGENQGNIVSLLRAEQSNYAFEADINEPGIILGLVSFSIPRMYSRTIDRFFFKKDRDDFFNPYFQNIGDQEIFLAEKYILGGLTPFAYTLRNMEYKQSYSVCSGGTIDHLKGWFFIADNHDSEDERYPNLSPDFIRSHNVEFDRFYESLTGLTLSEYFHFVIRFDNNCTPNRNMEYSPTIL